MKAEQRKELERNALAEQMTHMAGAIKGGPSKNTLIVCGIILLVVGGVYGFYRMTRSGQSKQSALWVRLDEETNVAGLQKLISENPGTNPARVAEFEEARYSLLQGLENLASPEQHESAIKNLERARELYVALAPKSKDLPVLEQEAMMGAAQAEEALSVGKKGDGTGMLGTLDKAAELYEKLATQFPETFQGKEARKRADEIKNNRAKVDEFYSKLSQEINKK